MPGIVIPGIVVPGVPVPGIMIVPGIMVVPMVVIVPVVAVIPGIPIPGVVAVMIVRIETYPVQRRCRPEKVKSVGSIVDNDINLFRVGIFLICNPRGGKIVKILLSVVAHIFFGHIRERIDVVLKTLLLRILRYGTAGCQRKQHQKTKGSAINRICSHNCSV